MLREHGLTPRQLWAEMNEPGNRPLRWFFVLAGASVALAVIAWLV